MALLEVSLTPDMPSHCTETDFSCACAPREGMRNSEIPSKARIFIAAGPANQPVLPINTKSGLPSKQGSLCRHEPVRLIGDSRQRHIQDLDAGAAPMRVFGKNPAPEAAARFAMEQPQHMAR
jgi:hypothetical protein